MISVEKAEKLLLENIKKVRNKVINIKNLSEEILAENILADNDSPPYNRVMMDGICIKYSDYEKGIREYNILGCQQAGEPQKSLTDSSNCFEVMTGSVLPNEANVVIKIEDIKICNKKAIINKDAIIIKEQFIHQKGMDHKKGDLLINTNTFLRATHWAILASIGKNKVLVKK